jgi:hypothetical protein
LSSPPTAYRDWQRILDQDRYDNHFDGQHTTPPLVPVSGVGSAVEDRCWPPSSPPAAHDGEGGHTTTGGSLRLCAELAAHLRAAAPDLPLQDMRIDALRLAHKLERWSR